MVPVYLSEGVGSFLKRGRIEEPLELFACENKNVNGIVFLRGTVSNVHDQHGLDASDFLYEICEGLPRGKQLIRNPLITPNHS